MSVGYDLLESQTVKTKFIGITFNFYLIEKINHKIKDKEKYMLILSLISLTNNVFIKIIYNMCQKSNNYWKCICYLVSMFT